MTVEELPATDEFTVLTAPVVSVRSDRRARLEGLVREYRIGALAYLASLAVLFCTALVNGAIRNVSLTAQLANWDGRWYYWVAASGYPHRVLHAQTRLGFMPLYPLFMRAVSSVFGTSLVVAGVIISCVGGFFAAILVQRLTTGWWGEESGRRAVVLFCAFPGAIVFAMVYSEGLLLPLAAGCILALERRRWVLAGVLAGIATAIEPDALALVVVCAVCSVVALRRRGIRDREALKSLIAPVLAPVGAAAFAAYLWAWTGTPFATYITQHTGWQEKTDLLAVFHNLQLLLSEIDLNHFNQPTINLNLVEGLIGVFVLIIGLVLLLRERRLISMAGWTWTLAISFLMITSENVPPNPRLLITAFPVILVFAHRLQGKRYAWLIAGNVVLLIGLSALTYVGVTIRP